MRISNYWSPLASAFLLSFALCVFATGLHAPPSLQWIALPAFLAAAFLIASFIMRPGFLEEWGRLLRWPGRHPVMLTLAVLLSIILAIRYRLAENMPLVPVSVEPFVLLSVSIGIAEEGIFRGLIQGATGKWGTAFSVYFGAIVFAAYKALLFIWPSPQNHTSTIILFMLTLFAGILLGYARQRSQSLWTPILAHGLFDLYVYMETPAAPWWLW